MNLIKLKSFKILIMYFYISKIILGINDPINFYIKQQKINNYHSLQHRCLNLRQINIIRMDDPIQSCQLIGFAGIMVQLVLGALSFSVLIYKRYVQKPKRAWKIWALDTSKQGVSQMLAHFVNIAISMSLANSLSSDACIWYLTTNILDNTLGVMICVGVLGLIEKHVLENKYKRFQSGNYYQILEQDDENIFSGRGSSEAAQSVYHQSLQITQKRTKYVISYFDWLIQFIIWNAIVVITKTLLFEIQLLLNQPIVGIATFLLGWIQPYEALQLILVIIIVPVIMNGLAFWIQDNFLKKKGTTVQTANAQQSQPQPPKAESKTESTEPRQSKVGAHEPLL